MSPQIQVPEPVNHLPDVSQKARHIRRLSALVGIPVLIVVIVVAVYFYNQSSRNSASEGLAPSINSNLQKNEPEMLSRPAGILPDEDQNKLPNGNSNLANYKARFEAINESLVDYDKIFSDLKISGSCYSSSQEKVTKQEAWAISLNILLDENVPEITDATSQEKITQLKQLNKDYTQSVREFVEGQNKISLAWLETKKAIFKICDNSIDQIQANCKDTIAAIDSYKKLLISENNVELFSSLDRILDYCDKAPNLVKIDNDVKFSELNNSFQGGFAKIVSTYPNIGDKTQTIRANQAKIEAVLDEVSK